MLSQVARSFWFAATSLALLPPAAAAESVAEAPPPPAAAIGDEPAAPRTPSLAARKTPAAPGVATAIGVRLDCLHDFNLDKGSAQACFNITGLRYLHAQRLSPKLAAYVRLDPFASPAGGKDDSPLRAELPTMRETDYLIIDDFALVWTPRPNLDVGLELLEGVARLPSVTGLALANSFTDPGWKQPALLVTYNLATFFDMSVSFITGNGEGELTRNVDPQQYFAFLVKASPVQGLVAQVGLSVDGNDAGGAERQWSAKQYQETCGFTLAETKLGHSTQRMAASLGLDGTLAAAKGLTASLGWQRDTLADLDKAKTGGTKFADLQKCPSLDPATVFVEAADHEAVNTVERTTYDIALKYQLFEGAFIAADFTQRKIDTGSVKLFETCASYAEGRCTRRNGQAYRNLMQDALTVGGGLALADGLMLTLEYSKVNYDRAYAQFKYYDANGKTSESIEYFNGRLAYDWR